MGKGPYSTHLMMMCGCDAIVLMRQKAVANLGRPGTAAMSSNTCVVRFASFRLPTEGCGQMSWMVLARAYQGKP